MKKTKRLLAFIIAVALFCSMMCVGATAASTPSYCGTATSTDFTVYDSLGHKYYCKYSTQANWVGYNYKTGYNGGREVVGIVQSRMFLGDNYVCTTSGNVVTQIDGYYGSDTYNAIYYYQSFYGSLVNDGTAGVATLKHCLYTNNQWKTQMYRFCSLVPYIWLNGGGFYQ